MRKSGKVKRKVGSAKKDKKSNWKKVSILLRIGKWAGLFAIFGVVVTTYEFIDKKWSDTAKKRSEDLPRRIFAKCAPSLVIVETAGQRNSGFIAEVDGKKYVYTVRHAVMDLQFVDRVKSEVNVLSSDGSWQIAIDNCECADSDAHLTGGIWVDIVRFETKTSLPALRFSRQGSRVEDRIFAMGFDDAGMGLLKYKEGKVHAANELYMLHDANTSIGFSGGPIVDCNGDVVAIDSFQKKIDETKIASQQDQNDFRFGLRLSECRWVPLSEMEKRPTRSLGGSFRSEYISFDRNSKHALVYTDSFGVEYVYKSVILPILTDENGQGKFARKYELSRDQCSGEYMVIQQAVDKTSIHAETNKWRVAEIHSNTFIDHQNVAILADRFFFGKGVETNRHLAAHLYNVAAEKGNVLAQVNMGVCYLNGYGVDRDDGSAFNWFSKAATNGDKRAQYYLALCYFYGRGCAKNEAEEKKWLEASAANDCIEAELELGLYRFRKGDWEGAINWLNIAAQKNPDALAYLGNCYEYGLGVARDENLALEKYRAAIDMGSSLAEMMMGDHYISKGDYDNAVRCFVKAKERGNPEAFCSLGQCYQFGLGVEFDLERAGELYRESVEKGSVVARSMLGVLYLQKEDYGNAIRCFEEAISIGDIEAKVMLGRCYQNGHGVLRDLRKAVDYYRDAAKSGSLWAGVALGDCYANGFGVESNATEAVSWYKKAADSGFPLAQMALGECYAEGFGVESNAAEAVSWYKRAADSGFSPAQEALGDCYAKGFGVETNMSKAVEYYQKAKRPGYKNLIDALRKE